MVWKLLVLKYLQGKLDAKYNFCDWWVKRKSNQSEQLFIKFIKIKVKKFDKFEIFRSKCPKARNQKVWVSKTR